MSTTEPGKRNVQTSLSVLATIGLAAIFVAVLAFGRLMFGSSVAIAEAAPTPAASNDSWPAAPPTFTPLPTPTAPPTATPVATPTPVPIPVWTTLNELAVVAYTIPMEAEEEAPAEGLIQLFGQDRVRIATVGRVKIGINMDQVSTVKREGDQISLILPTPTVLSVELLKDRTEIVSASKRMVFSAYEGSEIKALAKAEQQIRNFAAADESMRALARQVAELRIREYLMNLGFQDVSISFQR